MSALPEFNKEEDRRAITVCVCAIRSGQYESMKNGGDQCKCSQGLRRQEIRLQVQITISSVTTSFE